MASKQTNLLYQRFTRMHAPFPLLIILLVTAPWAYYVFTLPALWDIARWSGITASSYFLLAFFLYILLIIIRKNPRRKWTYTVVFVTRRYIQFHLPLAVIGVLWLLIHVFVMSSATLVNLKAMTGIMALLALSAVLVTGYMRKRKASGKRRRSHRYISYAFLIFLCVHLLI